MNIEAVYQFDLVLAVQRLLCCPPLDPVMVVLSTAGDGWFLVLVAGCLAWKANPDRRDALRSAIRCLAILAVIGVVVQVTKRIIEAPRPLSILGPERVRVLLEPLHHMSFPSGHAAAAAGVTLWAWRDPSVGNRWWLWLLAFLCGLSRVYVGAHWVTDVVAGWLVGAAVAVVVSRGWRPARAGAAPAAPAAAGAGAKGTPAPAVAIEEDPCG